MLLVSLFTMMEDVLCLDKPLAAAFLGLQSV